MPLSNIASYHRPEEIEGALKRLREGRGGARPLAGGTSLLGDPPRDVEEVVDLRDLRLDWIAPRAGGGFSVGATTTLEALRRDESLAEYAGGLIGQAARYAAGSLVRNRATLGGTLIARAGTSDLAALLLALGATVLIIGSGEQEVPLEELYRRRDYLLQPGSLLTEVHLPALPEGSHVALERIARTPMDQPILTVAALVAEGQVRVGVSGIGEWPAVEQGLAGWGDTAGDPAGGEERTGLEEMLARLEVRGDHLASAAYRRAMLPVLARRAAGG